VIVHGVNDVCGPHPNRLGAASMSWIPTLGTTNEIALNFFDKIT
jgi:hypothetical protein